MSGTPYTKDVLALSDHLFGSFPELPGILILTIAAETVEFYNNRKDQDDGVPRPEDINRFLSDTAVPDFYKTNKWMDDPQNGAPG